MKFEHGGGDGFSHKLIWNNGKDYVYVGVCSSKRAHREFPKAFSAAMNADAARVQLLAKALAFYANKDNHTVRPAGKPHPVMKDDLGCTARAALTEAGLNEQKEG